MKHIDLGTVIIWSVVLLIVYIGGVPAAIAIALLFAASWLIQKGNP
jgi:hypothetical protein